MSNDLLVFEMAHKRACLDSCFALSIDPSQPPENLEAALSLAKNNPQKLSIYACFARQFDKAIAAAQVAK